MSNLIKLGLIAALTLIISSCADKTTEYVLLTEGNPDAALTYEQLYPPMDAQFSELASSLYHNSFAIDSAGYLWGTGRNQYCELAETVTPCANNVTSYMKTNLGNVKSVASGNFHTAVLLNDKTIRMAGDKARGQTAVSPSTGTLNAFTQPTFENGATPQIEKIAAGHYGTVAIDSQGKVWGTGYYANGQLTFNNAPAFSSFINLMMEIPLPSEIKMKEISYGYDQVIAIDTNGDIWATGGNRDGQAGVGASVAADIFGFKKLENAGVKFVKVSAGGAGAGNGTDAYNGARHSLALDENGDIWATGNNSKGQLGLGNLESSNTFKKITKPFGVGKFTDIAAGGGFSIALDDKGMLWATGNNINYTLAIGETEYSTTFVKVPLPHGVTSYNKIAAGAMHMQAIDMNGRIWSAGANEYGQLGLGLATGLNSYRKFLSIPNFKNTVTAVEPTGVINPKVVDAAPAEGVIRIGFIGNSLTFTNDVPLRLKEIAAKNGKTFEVKYQAISGDNLNNQFNYRDWAAHRIISYYNPKYVFIQEQTAGRDEAPIGWWKAYAAANAVEPLAYQTWYNSNGCEGSNANGDNLTIRVAPSGHAFQKIIRNTFVCNQTQAQINSDTKVTKVGDYHPNMAGSYLSAITLYATIMGYDNATDRALISKPDVAEAQAIPDAFWTELVNAALGAIDFNKDKNGVMRSKRPFISNVVNNEAITLSKEYQEKTLEFGKYTPHNIPFKMPVGGKLDIFLQTEDTGTYYWVLRESNGRLIGKSAPSTPWPRRVSGDCLNTNSLNFLSAYECNESLTLSEKFFAYGDRIVNGVPYANQQLPAGDYVLTLMEAAGTNSSAKISIKYK